MKKALITLGAIIMFSFSIHTQTTNIYEFKVHDIDGNEFDFAQLEGKKVMIVNVASKCGYTDQYKALQELYQNYKNHDFIIIGFPANNFLWQEPGTNDEIKSFCTLNYGVTFPMMSKISVKGKDMHPVYQWLTQKSLNGVLDSKVSWNFQKYLLSPSGELERMVPTKISPDDESITNWITN